MNPAFWSGRRVFITGHTGFKGGWLSHWLQHLGAEVTGYSLAPGSQPNLFDSAKVASGMNSLVGDIRDQSGVAEAMAACDPEVLIHMAAQPLVRQSFKDPVETYSTNVMGTVNVLEGARHIPALKAVVIVTSDKCYENLGQRTAFREDDPMGGFDPYSSSKGCTELVTSAYRRSFFEGPENRAAIATARAGNVIGGGDWSVDRLVPDLVRAIEQQRPLQIRNPLAIRPWQHVLEPLNGYLALAERLFESGDRFGGGWNFGPDNTGSRTVQYVVEEMTRLWGKGPGWEQDVNNHPHEAHHLALDCSKAGNELGWRPRLALRQTLEKTVDWYKAYFRRDDMREFTLHQISEFQESATS